MADIREFVLSLQKSRKLSQAELAKCIGYKSQTSLVRIVYERANQESLVKFAQLLREAPGLELTSAENAQLDLILEKRKLGGEEYAAMESLRRLLQEGDCPETEIRLLHGRGGAVETLQQRYGQKTGMRMVVINCERVELFPALARLMREGRLKVEHYLYADDNLARTAEILRVVMPVLYEQRYAGYTCFDGCSRDEKPRGLLMSDMAICEYQEEGGEWKHDVMVFLESDQGVFSEFPGRAETIEPLLAAARVKAQPLRNGSLQEIRNGDYLAYVKYCSDLEQDREVYRFKPDFGIEQIPVSIWRRAIEEGSLGQEAEVEPLLESMEQVFEQRQKNAFAKKKYVYHVIKQRAVWNFVRTGRLSDQFWGFRTLTLAERLEALEFIAHQQEHNPYFKLLLLKEDNAIRDDEVVLYDGLGLLIVKPGTDYNLDRSHGETMVTNPDMMEVFKQFYQKSILQFHVQPESHTRRLLLEMMDYCRQEMLTEQA